MPMLYYYKQVGSVASLAPLLHVIWVSSILPTYIIYEVLIVNRVILSLLNSSINQTVYVEALQDALEFEQKLNK